MQNSHNIFKYYKNYDYIFNIGKVKKNVLGSKIYLIYLLACNITKEITIYLKLNVL